MSVKLTALCPTSIIFARRRDIIRNYYTVWLTLGILVTVQHGTHLDRECGYLKRLMQKSLNKGADLFV